MIDNIVGILFWLWILSGLILAGLCHFSGWNTLTEATSIIFFSCSVICVFWMLAHLFDDPDPNLRDQYDRTRWFNEIHNDPLTSDATEEDWHKDRSNENWYGM